MARKGGAGAGRPGSAKKLSPGASPSSSKKMDSAGAFARSFSKKIVPDIDGHKSTSVEAVRRQQQQAQAVWTHDARFQCIVSLAIISNAFSLGFEMDYGEDFKDVFLVLEHSFTAIFFLELLCKLQAERPKRYFSDSANILDFILVVLSVTEIWIIPLLGINMAMDTRSMSVLRILRLLRLVRLVKIFRVFKELTIMVEGMTKTWKIIFWGSVFLLVLVYMFAMVATMMFGKAYECDTPPRHLFDESSRYLLNGKAGDAPSSSVANETVVEEQGDICPARYTFPEFSQEELFGTLAGSMATLYMCLFEGCGWDVIRPMILIDPHLCVFWYLFIFLTSFGILNVILGLFCETVITSALEAEKQFQAVQEDLRQAKIAELHTLWQKMDKDGSGEITHDEFQYAITNDPQVMDCIDALGLGGEDDIFYILDFNKTTSLSHHEFFQGMLLLMNGNRPMTTKDSVTTYLTCQSNHNLLLALVDLLQESKVLGDLTVIKEGLRTYFVLPGQNGRASPTIKEMHEQEDCEELLADSQADSQITPREKQNPSSPVVPGAPTTPENGSATPHSTKDSVNVRGSSMLKNWNAEPLRLHLHDEAFQSCIREPIEALEARVSEMDHKIESRFGGLEKQLKSQQREFASISEKMDSIARVLEYMMIQSQRKEQDHPSDKDLGCDSVPVLS